MITAGVLFCIGAGEGFCMGIREQRLAAAERKGAPCVASKVPERGVAVQLGVRVTGEMAEVSLCLS